MTTTARPPSPPTPRFSAVRALWLVALSTGLGCAELPSVDAGVCGNGVIEAGEACEPDDAGGCGEPSEGTLACQFTCRPDAAGETVECPPGFGCGADDLCRVPAFAYATPSGETSWSIGLGRAVSLQAADLDGDRREELVVTELLPGADTAPVATASHRLHVITSAGVVASAAAGGPPALGVPDPGGPHYLVTAADQGEALGPSSPWRVASFGALAYEVTPPLELAPVLLGGAVRIEGRADQKQLLALDFRASETIDDTLVVAFDAQGSEVVAAQGVRTAEFSDRPQAWLDLNDALRALPLPDGLGGGVRTGRFADDATPACVGLSWRSGDQLAFESVCDQSGAPSSVTPPALAAGVGSAPAVEDLNDDGRDDLALVDAAGDVRLSYGVADGSFHSDPATLPTSAGDGGFGPPVGGADFDAVGAQTVMSARDRNGDGIADPITTRTFLVSCAQSGCACDTHECRPSRIPAYRATPNGLVDVDGDGVDELVAVATDQPPARDEAWEKIGQDRPLPGSLVVIGAPGTLDWSAVVTPLAGDNEVVASGDLNADGQGDVAVLERRESGDRISVAFGRVDRRLELVEVGVFDGVGSVRMTDGGLWVVSDGGQTEAGAPLAEITETRGIPGTTELRFVSGSLGSSPEFGETGTPIRTLLFGAFLTDDSGEQQLVSYGGENFAGAIRTRVALYENTGPGDYFDAEQVVRFSDFTAIATALLPAFTVLDSDADGIDELAVLATIECVEPECEAIGAETLGSRVQLLTAVDGRLVSSFATLAGTRDPATNLVFSDIEELYVARPSAPGEGTLGGGLGDHPEPFDLDGDGDDDLVVLTDEPSPRLALWFSESRPLRCRFDADRRRLLELEPVFGGPVHGVTAERLRWIDDRSPPSERSPQTEGCPDDEGVDADQFTAPGPLPVLDLIATGPSGTRRISVDLETGEILPDAPALPLPGGDDVVRADLSGDGIPDLAVVINEASGARVAWAEGL